MQIGELRHRVEIQTFTATQDDYGEPVKSWVTFATRWASVEPLSGAERWSAQQVRAEVTHRVTMRYLDGLSPQMRILHRGRVLEIDSVLDFPKGFRDREAVELMCIERVS